MVAAAVGGSSAIALSESGRQGEVVRVRGFKCTNRLLSTSNHSQVSRTVGRLELMGRLIIYKFVWVSSFEVSQCSLERLPLSLRPP